MYVVGAIDWREWENHRVIWFGPSQEGYCQDARQYFSVRTACGLEVDDEPGIHLVPSKDYKLCPVCFPPGSEGES